MEEVINKAYCILQQDTGKDEEVAMITYWTGVDNILLEKTNTEETYRIGKSQQVVSTTSPSCAPL